MLRNNSVQLEMFKADDEASGSQGVSGRNPLHLKKIRGYQKFIYTFVAFIFVSLVSFSFGVEKGKKQIAGIMPMRMEPASLPRAEPTSLTVEAGPLPSKQGPILLVNKNTTLSQKTDGSITLTTRKSASVGKAFPSGIGRPVPLDNKELVQKNYTIQVASISNAKYVSKELSKLRSKGYTAFSLTKGKYTVICVGRFNARKDAQINLVKMKNSYPDCQIRRL